MDKTSSNFQGKSILIFVKVLIASIHHIFHAHANRANGKNFETLNGNNSDYWEVKLGK